MDEPDRRAAIVRAAFEAFATYGFEKTSMAEIAQRAGMSRPALYLRFDDKTAVFRAVAEDLHARTAARCAAAAAGDGGLADRLVAIVAAKLEAHVEIVAASAHGRDLLDVNHRIGADLVHQADAAFVALVARQLRAGDGHDVVLAAHGLTARRAAAMLQSALVGFEVAIVAGEKGSRRLLDTFVRLFVAGLAPAPTR